MGDGQKSFISSTDRYWADVPSAQLIGNLQEKIDKFYSTLLSNGRVDVYRRAYRLLYGFDANGTYKSSRMISFGGEEGEVVHASANLLRAFTRAMHTQIVGSRPSYSCRTTADDSAALDTVKAGNALLDYCYSREGMEREASKMAWYALPSGEGWLFTRWDHFAGRPLGVSTDMETDPLTGEDVPVPGTEKIAWGGKLAVTALKPEDVVRDPLRTDGDHDWLVVSTVENRWNLARRYPKFRTEILNAAPPSQWVSIRSRLPTTDVYRDSVTDVVPVFELWHKKTDALPSGRHALMIGTACIVIDEAMPYSRLPVSAMIPNYEVDSAFGYGETWDLLNLQQALTSIVTQIVTNRENWGARSIWTIPGTRIVTSQLQGNRIFESTQKPEPLDFGAGYMGEVTQAWELIKSAMQLQTGMNDTVMGDASKSQSGEALRMLHSMAMQYNSGFQAAFNGAMEHAMSMVIEAYQLFAPEEVIVPIVGRGNRPTVKRFKAEDLATIDSVQIEVDDASMRTNAGRIEVANTLFQAQAIDPDTYLKVRATGRLEPALDRPQSQRTLIDSENERLMNGEMVEVADTDHHANHMAEHSVVFNDPDIRRDPAKYQAALVHFNKHSQAWLNITLNSPDILAATGQQPSPLAALVQAQQAAMAGQQPQPGMDQQPAPEAPTGGPGGAGFPAMDPNIPPAPVPAQEPQMSPTTMG